MANRKSRKQKQKPTRKRATTVERAERALEQASDKPKPRTDDPARDKAPMNDGVIGPLPHAD